jgi:hypothetical protein
MMIWWWFFNSVPQTRLLDAVHQLLDQWMLAHEKHFDNDHNLVTISVDLSARGDPVQSTYSGTLKRIAFQTKCLYVSDIFEIVQSSLTLHTFSALGCFLATDSRSRHWKPHFSITF